MYKERACVASAKKSRAEAATSSWLEERRGKELKEKTVRDNSLSTHSSIISFLSPHSPPLPSPPLPSPPLPSPPLPSPPLPSPPLQEKSVQAAASGLLGEVKRKQSEVQLYLKLADTLRDLRDGRREANRKKGMM